MAQPVLKDPSQVHHTSSVSHILVQTLQQHLISNIVGDPKCSGYSGGDRFTLAVPIALGKWGYSVCQHNSPQVSMPNLFLLCAMSMNFGTVNLQH